MRAFFLLGLFLSPGLGHARAVIKAKIEFVEALAPRDTTSSTRYTKSYEGTISLAKDLLGKKLQDCGYELETKTSFYDASDSLKAKELASAAESAGAWLLVGPRRSNHYLLLAQGAPTTPTASLMASSDKITELGSRHVTLSPLNSRMAKTAAIEAQRRTKKKAKYVSVVSSDCSNCVDFSKSFDEAAKKLGLQKLDEVPISGEEINFAEVKDRISKSSPDFVLLPNYSKVSSAVMSGFNTEPKPPLFVGGDGWGDSQYGFVQNGLDIQRIRGITVRGFPPLKAGLAAFELGRAVTKSGLEKLEFTPDLSLLKILDETVVTLCKNHPKNKSAFSLAFENRQARALFEPWGVSIFDVDQGQIKFGKVIGMKK